MSDVLNYLSDQEQRALYAVLQAKFNAENPEDATVAAAKKAAERRNNAGTLNAEIPGIKL